MSYETRGMAFHNCDEWKRIAHELLAIIETLHESEAKPTDKTLDRARNIMVGRYFSGKDECE